MKSLPRKLAGFGFVVSFGLVLLAGCTESQQTSENEGGANTDLKGDVTIEGSSTVAPISSAAATEF